MEDGWTPSAIAEETFKTLAPNIRESFTSKASQTPSTGALSISSSTHRSSHGSGGGIHKFTYKELQYGGEDDEKVEDLEKALKIYQPTSNTKKKGQEQRYHSARGVASFVHKEEEESSSNNNYYTQKDTRSTVLSTATRSASPDSMPDINDNATHKYSIAPTIFANRSGALQRSKMDSFLSYKSYGEDDSEDGDGGSLHSVKVYSRRGSSEDLDNSDTNNSEHNVTQIMDNLSILQADGGDDNQMQTKGDTSSCDNKSSHTGEETTNAEREGSASAIGIVNSVFKQWMYPKGQEPIQEDNVSEKQEVDEDESDDDEGSRPSSQPPLHLSHSNQSESTTSSNNLINLLIDAYDSSDSRTSNRSRKKGEHRNGGGEAVAVQKSVKSNGEDNRDNNTKKTSLQSGWRRKKKKKKPPSLGGNEVHQQSHSKNEDEDAALTTKMSEHANNVEQQLNENVETYQGEQRQQNWGGLINMFQPNNNKVNESPAERKDTGEMSLSDQIMPQSTDEAGEEKIPLFRRIISSSDEPLKHPPPPQSIEKMPSSKSGSGECMMPVVQLEEMVNGESSNLTERGPDLCTPSTADSNSYTQSSTNNSPLKHSEHQRQAQQIEEESQVVVPFFKRLISGQQEDVVGVGNETVAKDKDDDGDRGISNVIDPDHPTEGIMREEGGTRSETYAETLDPVDRTVGPSPLNNSILSSSETLPSFYSSASEISRFRPSLVNDFRKSQTRESFQRSSQRESESLIDDGGEGNGGVDWPSPVSSLGSPPTVPVDEEGEGEKQDDDSVGPSISASKEDAKCNVAAASSSSRSKEGSSNNSNPKEENENIPTASDDKFHEDIHINLEDSRGGHIDFTNCKPPPPPTRSRSYGDASFPVQSAVRPTSNRSQALSHEYGSMDSLDFGENVDNNEPGVDWGKLDGSDRTSGSRYGALSQSVNSTGFDNALTRTMTRTDSVKKKLGKLKASVQSTGSHNMIRSYRKPSTGSRSRQGSVSAMSDLSFGTENSPGVNERNHAPHGVAATAEDRSNKFNTFYHDQMMQTPDPEVEKDIPSSEEVQEEKEKVEATVMQVSTFRREMEEEQERTLDVSQSSSKLPPGTCNRVRGRSSIARSDVSSLASFASPVYLEKTRRQSDMMMMRREKSDSSLSSMDSFASPTQQMVKKKDDQGTMVETASEVKAEEMYEETSGNNVIENVQVDIAIYGDEILPHPGPRHQMARSFHSEKSSSFHRPERPLPRGGSAKLSDKSDSFKLEESSMTMDDLNSINGDNLDSYKASGLANDVALHLEHSTKSLNTSFFSTDGIDCIDPSATSGEGREDFGFALNAYTNAISHGHFDFHDNKATLDGALEGSDEVLAARGYLGLGFARQCKGELESSLDAYTTFLTLWEDEMGSNDPLNASVQFTIGTVLIEMQRQLEAANHFTKALHLYKRNESTTDDGNRASILSTEGMLFSVLGEGSRAIDCLRQAVLVYQTAHQSMNLKFATIMFEMGSLLSQMGKYEDSGNCFSFALEIRKALLGDSFVVARTHYSLGVTLASQELKANISTASATHLEEALRICEGEFESDHVQSAIIVHALGVLNERKGDFLTASVWFAKEHAMRKILFGEDHESVACVCADLGTCYYNSGRYEFAISTFEDDLRIILLSDNDRSLEVAEALYKIASCHDSLCNYDEALEKFYEVKQIRESLFGVESCPVIQTMLRIGNIQLCKGEVKKALDCFSEVLGIGYASDSVNAVEVANALYGRGCAQFCLFNLTDAMKSLSESLNWKLAALGEDDPGLACIFYQMAHVYLEQSEAEEAITCFEEYLRLQKLEQQRNLHDNAEICYAEGIVAKLKGQQDAALSFYNQALAMFDTLFGGEHEKVASIHFDIGYAHSVMGDHDAALGHLQTCLIQRRKLLGCHVDVANVLYEIASIFSQQNQTQLAVKCMIEADRIWNEKLENNEKLTSVLLLSGKLWKSLQCYQAAETNFEQALEQAITIYGQEHELVARILLNLGELLHEINQMQQALFCFDESIQVRTALYGPDSPSVAQAEYSKGVALLFHGNFEDATACLDRALAIRREHFGPMDVDVGDILNTMGFLQLRMGNISGQEVMDPLKEALEIRRAIGNKSKVVSTLQNIASVYKKRKDYDSCLATHAEILRVRQEEFGSNDVRVSDAWMSLGNIQTIAGRLDEATISYEEALRIRTLINGYNHTSVAHVLFKIGSINSRQSNYTGAKQLFEEYIRIRAEEEDDPDEEMAQALTLMGDLQKETNEKSKAQINWMSAQEIYQQLGYPDTHPKLTKLRARIQSSKGSVMNFFGGSQS